MVGFFVVHSFLLFLSLHGKEKRKKRAADPNRKRSCAFSRASQSIKICLSCVCLSLSSSHTFCSFVCFTISVLVIRFYPRNLSPLPSSSLPQPNKNITHHFPCVRLTPSFLSLPSFLPLLSSSLFPNYPCVCPSFIPRPSFLPLLLLSLSLSNPPTHPSLHLLTSPSSPTV